MTTEATYATTTERLVNEFEDAFTTDTRADGTAFTLLAEGSPTWMTDAIREAHGGMAPDDWVYEHCGRILSAMSERLRYAECGTDGAALAVLEDSQSDVCDGLVDIYNSDLTRWLASSLDRIGYCDEAVEQYGWPEPNDGVVRVLSYGQMCELEQFYQALLAGIRGRVEYLAGLEAEDDTDIENDGTSTDEEVS